MSATDPEGTAPGPETTGPGDAAGILIVNDRRSNLVALEALLEPLGRRIVLAQSGEEALRILLSERFALILLDVQMPGMDGFELARYIRERPQTRRTPIIFVTAVSTATQHIFDGYQAGAVNYLLKPVDPVILRSKVSVFIELFESSRRLQRHAQLQGVHDSLALAQRAARSGVWDWDLKADRLYLSPEYADLVGLGAPPASAEGSLLATADPRDQERIGRRLRGFLEHGEVWDEDYRIVHPRRGVRWLATRGKLSRDEGGSAERFTGIAIDITDRHVAEDRLRRLHAATVALTAAATPDEVAELVVEHGRRATGATAAWLVLPEDGGRARATSPGWAPGPDDLERARRALAEEGPAVWTGPDATRLAIPLGPAGASGPGVLGLTLARADGLDDEERGFLAAFATQCGQALQRSRLFQTERESRRRTESLQAATAALAAAVTRRDVGEAVVREALRAFDATSASVRLLDPDTRALETVAVGGFPDGLARPLGSSPLDEPSPTADAAREGRALYLSSAAGVQARYPGVDRVGAWPARGALAALPLQAEDRAIGTLSLRFDRSRAFGADDREALEAFAGLAAQSAVRASLHEAEQRRRVGSDLLAEAGFALDADLGVSERLRRLAALLVPRLGDACCIELAEGGSVEVAAVSARTPELEALVREIRERFVIDAARGPGMRRVMESGEPLHVQHVWPSDLERYVAAAALDPETAGRLRRSPPRSILVVPIGARGRGIGAIGLVSCASARAYDAQDLRLLEDIGRHAGLALDNARLYEAQVGVALTLQESLLPPGLPVLRDLGLAARYLSAAVHTEASGDWYEAVALSGDRVFLAVGDVVGRGTEAAAVMGQLRSAMRAFALAGLSPSAALAKLSDFAAGVPGAEVSTAAAAEVNLARGRVTYACAGHLPPLLVGAGGTASFLSEGRGPALGIRSHGYREAVEPFEEGSALVLYTDGLVERRREPLDAGLERLAAVAAAASSARPSDLCERLIDALVDRRSIADDVAVLVARRQAAVRPLALTVTAEPRALGEVREAVRAWLADAEVDPAAREDVVLACGEAVANSVEHAYAGRPPGPAEVELSLAEDRTLRVRVRDEGRWRPPSEDPPGLRGRGLFLMRNLMDRVEVNHDAGGTEVRMSLRAGMAPAQAPVRPAPPGPPVPASVAFAAGPDGTVVGLLRGEIDASGASSLREQIERAAGRGGDIALDLDGVGYIDSTGARLLVDVAKRLSAAGGRLELRAPTGSPARRLIALCRLDMAAGITVDGA